MGLGREQSQTGSMEQELNAPVPSSRTFSPKPLPQTVLRASSKGLWPDPVPGSSLTPTPLCALSTQSFPYNLMSEEFWLWTVQDTWEQTTSEIGQRNKEKGPWSPSPHTQTELSGGSLKARGTVVRPTPNFRGQASQDLRGEA